MKNERHLICVHGDSKEIAMNKNSTRIGKVFKCEKLYVRFRPSVHSADVHVIDKGTELLVDLNESTKDFFKVFLSSGVEGYCMRKYITLLPEPKEEKKVEDPKKYYDKPKAFRTKITNMEESDIDE